MELSDDIKNIYNAAIGYYTESNVDLQFNNEHYILYIYWPEIKITNEYDDSITINKLFAKIEISLHGLFIYLQFIKSEYDYNQWSHDYIHSHVHLLEKEHPFEWKDCCLGSGPLVHTVSELRVFTNLNTWVLFFWELDKYVHTESLAGVPYKRISEVKFSERNSFNPKYKLDNALFILNKNNYNIINKNNYDIIKNFLGNILHNNILPFSYNNNFKIALSAKNLVYQLTKEFLIYLKDTNPGLTESKIIKNACNSGLIVKIVTQKNNSSISNETSDSKYDKFNDFINNKTPIFTFKGKDVYFTENKNSQSSISYIMNLDLVYYIEDRLCTFLDINYGKEYSNQEKGRIL